MKTLTPDVCDSFSCIDSKCPDTCCAGWNIYVDDNSVAYYTSVNEPIGDELRQNIITNHTPASFRLTPEGRCPFLNENNLCRLYITLGPDKLCGTCTMFPRLHLQNHDLMLSCTSLACPESARLYLTQTSPLRITAHDEPQFSNATFSSSSAYILTVIQTATALIQDRSLTLKSRLILTILYYYNRHASFVSGKNLSAAQAMFSSPALYQQLLDEQPHSEYDLILRLRLFRSVAEILKLGQNETLLTNIYKDFNQSYVESDRDIFIHSLNAAFSSYEIRSYDIEKENLLVYIFLRYTIHPVIEDDITSALALGISFYITYLCFVAFASLHNQKLISFEHRLTILSRLARFFEHNSQNTSLIYRKMKEDGMTDPQALLNLL